MRLNCYTNLKIELWSPSPFSVFDSLKNECNERAEVHGGGVQCGFLLKLPGFGISCRVPEHLSTWTLQVRSSLHTAGDQAGMELAGVARLNRASPALTSCWHR